MTDKSPVLVVRDLNKTFLIESSFVAALKKRLHKQQPDLLRALHGLSFDVMPGETLGILGESGSGKSTLARILMGIYEPDSGSAMLLGKEIVGATGARRLAILRHMQMVFQDPFGSLDPRMNVRQIISEPLKIHGIKPADGIEAVLSQALHEVGLDSDALERYPSEFSGGQRQRIGICRALMLCPKMLIADEAVSALDVSVQAQILELLARLRIERQLSMIFISHDVAVVRQIADRVILLYRGHLVEELNADDLIDGARHPYTRKLLGAALFLREGNKAGSVVSEQPHNSAVSSGCCYRSSCSEAFEKCSVSPELAEINPGHRVACWRK